MEPVREVGVELFEEREDVPSFSEEFNTRRQASGVDWEEGMSHGLRWAGRWMT